MPRTQALRGCGRTFKPLRPQVELAECIRVPLTQGQYAIVDLDAPAFVRERNWQALWSPSTQTFYAVTSVHKDGGGQWHPIMHRIILGLTDRTIHVDHIDHNGLNNRRSNLRECSSQQNRFNVRSRRGTSKFKGVWWDKNRRVWRAGIKKDKRNREIGSFSTEEEAALAYNEAAIRLFGEFAHLNVIDTAKA